MEPPDPLVLGRSPLRRRVPARVTLELGPPGPTAARLAGVVIAGAYALGVVDGPVVAAVGGVALVTLGRAIVVDGIAPVVACVGLGIVAAATGVASIRWGTLEVAELHGAQAVLGPTIATGDTAVVAWSIVAALGGLIGVVLWASVDPPSGAAWDLVETTVVAATLVVVFAVVPIASGVLGTAVVVAVSGHAMRRFALRPKVAAVAGALALGATASAAAGISLVR